MKNVWLVFKRDVLRLLKVPPALVVVLFLLVLPSVYTWYNVAGFWDPYGNTSALRVCVVNEDRGAESDLTGPIDVGQKVVDALKENDQLDWVFVDRDQAEAQLQAGECYAMFIIPKDFSEKLLTVTTGDFQQPKLEYYVNEKTGPVAPKITDTGSSTLDRQINSVFVGTVAEAAVKAVDSASQESHQALAQAQSKALHELDQAVDALGSLDQAAAGVDAALRAATDQAKAARTDLDAAFGNLEQASQELKSASQAAADASKALNDFSTQGLSALSKTTASLSQTSAKATAAVSSGLTQASKAKADVDASLTQAEQLVSDNAAAIAQLEGIHDKLPSSNAAKGQLGTLIESLNAVNASASDAVASLKGLSASMGQSIADMEKANSDFAQASDGALAALQDGGTTLFETTLPSVASAVGDLSASASDLSASVSGQKALVSQAQTLSDQVADTLGLGSKALDQSRQAATSARDELTKVRTDVASLSTAGFLAELVGTDSLDSAHIAEFMAAPAQLETVQLYPVTSYGTSMAPLFMNLTFWIGAFMLLIIMRQEVDGKGIKGLTLTQRYLGRFLLLALMVVLQSAICVSGLLFMGVQPASAPALYLAAAVCSLAYLSIIYALSITLQHVGKGICIILVFAQIPGATGLYPIEMTSPFFQAVYPLFPFTYGIGALREAICGFYGNDYGFYLAILGLFFALFLALGIVFRPLLSNVNRMFARQIKQGDLYNGENVQIPARRYRMSQVMRALSDQEGFRQDLAKRYLRFEKAYPRLIRAALIGGIAVPVAFTVAFSLNMTEKVVLLTAWLLWFGAVSIFLIVVESVRYSMRRQMRLDSMSESTLRGLYRQRDAMDARQPSAQPESSDGEGGRE